jgi:hypothetical protein
MDVSTASDEDLRTGMQMMGEAFRDMAPMSAAQAATVILDAVKAGEWRILVGDDAHGLDTQVRLHPDEAYDERFLVRLQEAGLFSFMQ